VRILFAIIALLIAPAAYAQTARVAVLSWINPTQYTDGSALPPTNIAETCSGYSLVSGGPYTVGTQCFIGSVSTGTFTLPATPVCGKFYFTAWTVDTSGNTSAVSNEAVKTLPCRPLPPTNLTVN